MDLITSRSNSKIKAVRALRRTKGRRSSGLFLIEGIRPVGEAVEASVVSPWSPQLESIFYAPEILNSHYASTLVAEQSTRGLPCYATSAEVFDSIADKDNPQGILAVARQREDTLSALTPSNFPWGVALVSPQDPGNLGTIFRTLDAVGASGLLLLESSVDPYHPTSVRASMGTLFWYPLVTTGFGDFAGWATRHGYHIFGTSAHGSRDFRQLTSYPRPRILLMGSEREGLTEEQAAVCDELVRLPMHGRATSLNLAVATGILLYAMLEKDRSV